MTKPPRRPPLPEGSPDWLQTGMEHIWLPYTQMAVEDPPLAVTGAEGVHIRLADGRELLDGMASWWTACHGYNHPRIVAAIREQAEALCHVMFGGLANEPALTLARRLAHLAPGDLSHVFFSDSGSVAVEVALKMAQQYWFNKGETGRTRFVCFTGGYHGDTFGAMGVSDADEGFHRVFKDALIPQLTTDIPRDKVALESYREILDKDGESIAGVIIEPLVQGAGGMLFHDAQALGIVIAEAQARGIPVIADEIFTGFGRLGHMFACDAAGVVPDIMCLSKALTGGALGLGATIARPHIFEAFLGDGLDAAFMHGPTFMANPIACAAANASLDLFEDEPRVSQAARMEAQLLAGLAPCRDMAGVTNVRAMGAIGVVEVDDLPFGRLTALRRAFIERGLWVRPFGRIVYLTPALTMGEADIDRLASGIRAVLHGN
ncbi:MAG TPA: adenosylmethionine--8-amino-7-oxononanoate transaminase [Alphaproteobacteria bacterium]|nr:adenosylmethionine--8-amino-7-oxononanoate transaminase [Alphaproteobacteria bacterium]